MPLVHVQMATGRTPEQKRALLDAMTDAVQTHLGVDRSSIRVWITEFAATDYMAGGELLADKRTRLAASDDVSGDPPVPER